MIWREKTELESRRVLLLQLKINVQESIGVYYMAENHASTHEEDNLMENRRPYAKPQSSEIIFFASLRFCVKTQWTIPCRLADCPDISQFITIHGSGNCWSS
jgi:hypothetical protein